MYERAFLLVVPLPLSFPGARGRGGGRRGERVGRTRHYLSLGVKNRTALEQLYIPQKWHLEHETSRDVGVDRARCDGRRREIVTVIFLTWNTRALQETYQVGRALTRVSSVCCADLLRPAQGFGDWGDTLSTTLILVWTTWPNYAEWAMRPESQGGCAEAPAIKDKAEDCRSSMHSA